MPHGTSGEKKKKQERVRGFYVRNGEWAVGSVLPPHKRSSSLTFGLYGTGITRAKVR